MQNWIEKYCEIIRKTPDYKNETDITYQRAMKDDFERYCKDKVIAFLRYLFYNRCMTPFSSSLSIFKPRGTMFKDRRIDIGDYVMTDTLVERTRFEKREYSKEDAIKHIRAKYELLQAVSELLRNDKYDSIKFYKGFFFVKDPKSAVMNDTYADVAESFVRFMKFDYSIEYHEILGERYSPNKNISIFDSKNSEEEQELFLHLILKYDEISPQERQMLNRDHWEILDYEWRKELFCKLWYVLRSKKWYQCSEYCDMLCEKLLHPAMYRFKASRYIINSHTDEKRELFDNFVALDETTHQNIFKAIEQNCYDGLDEDAKLWCNIIIELDDYAEKILIEQEDTTRKEAEERNVEYAILCSKKEEYEKLEKMQKKNASQTCGIIDYPLWITVSSFDDSELEKAIENCKQQDLIYVANLLSEYSLPVAYEEINRWNDEEEKLLEASCRGVKAAEKIPKDKYFKKIL